MLRTAVSTIATVAVENPHLDLTAWGVVVIAVLVIAPIVLFLAALISILASARYTGGGKLLWVVLILCLPLLGPLAWFIAGRNAVIRTAAP